jgi:hypothetical protein
MKNKNFYDRLKQMPEVFTNTTGMRLMDLDETVFKNYMHRWAKAGYIKASGPKTGVYFNLIANPNADKDHAITALQLTYPTAILRGESVLNAAGWTTQIPRQTTVAVLNNRKEAAVEGFVVSPRSKSWLIKIHPERLGANDADFSTYGLPSLPPALALADLWLDKGGWHPDPDDLDVEPEQWVEVKRAFQLLNLEVPEIYHEMIPPEKADKKSKRFGL